MLDAPRGGSRPVLPDVGATPFPETLIFQFPFFLIVRKSNPNGTETADDCVILLAQCGYYNPRKRILQMFFK
jgi:hypothetical protein